jgi:hypothetical protein
MLRLNPIEPMIPELGYHVLVAARLLPGYDVVMLDAGDDVGRAPGARREQPMGLG